MTEIERLMGKHVGTLARYPLLDTLRRDYGELRDTLGALGSLGGVKY